MLLLGILIGLVIGVPATLLVYRNNQKKAQAKAEQLSVVLESAQAKAEQSVAGVVDKIKTKSID